MRFYLVVFLLMTGACTAAKPKSVIRPAPTPEAPRAVSSDTGEWAFDLDGKAVKFTEIDTKTWEARCGSCHWMQGPPKTKK